ncbi:DeoR family transcriptional regulator [Pediococcus pentosaceus]|uniref:DeoR family transcriptional regulator n=1 Tax=Pediococcus pentosaceus TaxID=1255 RepID=UPI001F3A5599|nr:DeoR family transcriptional regulator [Pediococcus pentosaceus]MCE5960955.1 DeoR family transcriptional regulator [Pediococcus pentosaceus]
MIFKERQALRKQATIELNLGNIGEYEKLMRKAREASPNYKTPLEKVWGSNNVKVVKRRKMVKELVEAGWDKKEITERCGAADTTIRKDIRILKEIGTIKDKQETS